MCFIRNRRPWRPPRQCDVSTCLNTYKGLGGNKKLLPHRIPTVGPVGPNTTNPQTSPPWWCRLPLLLRGIFGCTRSDASILFPRGLQRAQYICFNNNNSIDNHLRFERKIPSLFTNLSRILNSATTKNNNTWIKLVVVAEKSLIGTNSDKIF